MSSLRKKQAIRRDDGRWAATIDMRRCLKCGSQFESIHKGNRICQNCAPKIEALSNARYLQGAFLAASFGSN